jgi:hypothetical protein
VQGTYIAEAAALIAHYIEGISKKEFLEDTLRCPSSALRASKHVNGPGDLKYNPSDL